jgi:hypothetical protein
MHETEVLTMGEGYELLCQDEYPDLHTVKELFLCQMLCVGVDPIDEVLNLVNKGRHPV